MLSPTKEDIIIFYGTFSPLNLDPLGGGEPASLLDPEQGPYLHLSSLIIFLPHHHRHHSFSKHWVRPHVVLDIVNAVPHVPLLRVTGVPSLGLVLQPKPPTWDILTNNEYHRFPPAGARIRLPLISTPR